MGRFLRGKGREKEEPDMSGYNEFKRVVRNLLLGFLVLWLALIWLGVGMFFSGRGIVAGIAMSLLWSFPLGYMLVTDEPVQRPRASARTLARRRKRLAEYRLPNAEGPWIEETSSAC